MPRQLHCPIALGLADVRRDADEVLVDLYDFAQAMDRRVAGLDFVFVFPSGRKPEGIGPDHNRFLAFHT